MRCYTFNLVVRNDGNEERTCKAIALAYESFDTKLDSILYKKISLELTGNITYILSLHFLKIRVHINDLSLFVD